jgi:hypothetical protein
MANELYPDNTPSARVFRFGCGALVGVVAAWGSTMYVALRDPAYRYAVLAVGALVGGYLAVRRVHAFFRNWEMPWWLS